MHSPAAADEIRTTEVGSTPLTYAIRWLSPHRAQVFAYVEIPTSPKKVWAVCTDYDRLSEFIPNMTASGVIKRNGHLMVLHQEGEIRFPFYRKQMKVTLRVKEVPPDIIFFELLEGDFSVYQGSWRLEASDKGTLLITQTIVEPNFWMPQWVLTEMERQTLKRTFRALIRRCLTPGS